MIYLDSGATTKIDSQVYEAMIPFLTSEYGNPSSKYYSLATKAKEAVEESRYHVAKLINANPDEIIFTAGSTESSNMIIKGVADYKRFYECRGNHIITSLAEHKAILNTCKFLNGELYSSNDAIFSLSKKKKKVDRGYEVTFLKVNEYGQIEIRDFYNVIKPTTVLATFIWGNNEIGTLNDIDQLGSICRKYNILFHTDATQVLGKIDIDVKSVPVDFMSFSAHKLYGPKGIGAAYIKSDDYGLPPFTSLIHGGEQESGIRAGTLAVHNIVGFGKAAEIAQRDMGRNREHLEELEKIIIGELKMIPFVRINGNLAYKVPGIISLVVDNPYFNNELFLKKLSDRLALSTGSACTAGQPSHVLKAIGHGDDNSNVIRISIAHNLDKANLIEAVGILKDAINNL